MFHVVSHEDSLAIVCYEQSAYTKIMTALVSARLGFNGSAIFKSPGIYGVIVLRHDNKSLRLLSKVRKDP